MRARILDIKINLRQPWLLCVLLIAVIPLFPEYISPFLAVGALIAAHFDAKARRRDFVVGGLGKLLLLYIVYMAVTIIFSANPFNSVTTVLMWVMAFLVYVSLTTVLSNRHRFDTALFCVTLIAGVVGILLMMAVTKPLVGKGYLYPLIPFDGKKLKRLLHRVPIRKDNS